ncbi:MAG: hypothetical protein R3358_05285 [Woeseiaceae bacterium]|nr:hypothetical protein [Woeseiaceae bacterium]
MEKVDSPGDGIMKSRIVLFASLMATLIAGNALACGDSLYRVGKGVSYRVYTAPLPGSVLVYGEGIGAQQLAQELARSGHGVRLVTNDSDLKAEIGSGTYDVVIAAYSAHPAIESTSSVAENAPTYLPVALDSDEAAQAFENYDRVMLAERDEIKHFLKAIHQTLKQRS